MNGNSEENLAAKFIATIDLMEFGIQLMRQNLARKHPKASAEFINQELQRWINERPTVFPYVEDAKR